MPSIAELKKHGLILFTSGKILPALQLYDAIVQQYPLDYEARLRVADCLAAQERPEAATRVFRAVAWYAMKSGHPLTALVIAKVLEASEISADDLLTRVL